MIIHSLLRIFSQKQPPRDKNPEKCEDYKTNASSQLELTLKSCSNLGMSQITEDVVARHHVNAISCLLHAMFILKFVSFNPILTNYNIILGCISCVALCECIKIAKN